MAAGAEGGGSVTQQQVFIQNPHHSYGTEFVRIFAQKYGLKAVCNYTDARDATVSLPRYPSLLGPDVVASLHSAPGHVESLIAVLATQYNIGVALPHNEIVLSDTIRINEALGLDWVSADVLRRFRNKESLKDYVRLQDPSLGISPSVLVSSVQDIRDAMERYGFNRVVLKPNDGWGNLGVGFFDRDSSDAQLAQFIADAQGHQLLLEEYFGGREFYTCGQVDGQGNVTTFALFETVKGEANGRENIDYEVRLVRSHDEAFAPLMAFTEGVVRATGLTRSPFHVDMKFDDGQPKLIEMGARMVGDSRAYDLNHVHGGGIDVFDISSHYYLTADPYGPINLDWDRYNSVAFRSVQGINSRHQRLYAMGGVREVEALPQFVRWAHKTAIGDTLPVTQDLLSAPWQVTIQGASEDELDRTSHHIRSLLTINDVANPVRRAALQAKALLPGIARNVKLRTSPIHLTNVPVTQTLAITSS